MSKHLAAHRDEPEDKHKEKGKDKRKDRRNDTHRDKVTTNNHIEVPCLRRTAAAALLLFAGCAPIYQPAGCPKPCPESCPASCLASGYCPAAEWQPPASPPLIRTAGSVNLVFGDFPPAAPVEVSVHAVLDLVARGDSIPWDYSIQLDWSGMNGAILAHVVDVSAFNAVDFPIVADWSGETQTTDSGVLVLDYHLAECSDRKGRQEKGCIFLPATAVSAKLIDASPWREAPACP